MLVNMLEAKTHLSRLVEAVLRGEEVVIANRGKPVVRLVLAEPAKPKRKWGALTWLWTEAEIDAAFSPRADAEAAADLLGNLQRRELRVMEPAAPYKSAQSLPKTLAVKGKAKAKARSKKP